MITTQQLFQAKLRGSTLSTAFGLDFAYQCALASATRAWKVESTGLLAGSWTGFDNFVHTSFCDTLEVDGVPHGLPPHAIPFFTWSTPTLDAYVYQAHTGWWYVFDMIAPDPALVIPSEIFKPYAQHSAVRHENTMKGVDPRPLWFIRSDGGLGFPVAGRLPSLWHEEKDLLRLDGTPRKSIKIKFGWPGYELWDRQIRPESGKGDRSVKRLAALVAAKVRSFMNEHDASNGHVGTVPRYVIGIQPGQISCNDVLLLGIVMVSSGAAMPIMQLRDGFEFAS